jgi:hypothetical protein
MNEDQVRNRLGNGTEDLAVLRHMAMNVMQSDTAKGPLPGSSARDAAGSRRARFPQLQQCCEGLRGPVSAFRVAYVFGPRLHVARRLLRVSLESSRRTRGRTPGRGDCSTGLPISGDFASVGIYRIS